MKKRKGIIGTIALITSLLYVTSVMFGVAIIICSIINIFNKDFEMPTGETFTIVSDLDEIFSDKGGITTDYNLSYDFYNSKKDESIYNYNLESICINHNSIMWRIFACVRNISIVVLSILWLMELNSVFISLEYSIKNKEWFSMIVYHSLIKITYYTIAIFVIQTLFTLLYYFMIDNVTINGIKVHLIPNTSILSTICTVSILFVIAQVYKEGIKLSQDLELTI